MRRLTKEGSEVDFIIKLIYVFFHYFLLTLMRELLSEKDI